MWKFLKTHGVRIWDQLKAYSVQVLIGPPLDPKKRILLRMEGSPAWEFSVSSSLTTTLVTGSSESGKTTRVKTILLGMMRARYGGLVLVVKGTLPNDIREVARLAGRESDLVFLGENYPARYNPFELVNSAAEGAVLLAEIAKASQSGDIGGATEDRFWAEIRDVQLRKLCTLCLFAHQRLSVPLLAELFNGLPDSPSQAGDPEWQKNSPAWPHLKAAMASESEEAKNAAHSLLKRQSASHSKLQDSINALITVLLDRMNSEPLRTLFGGEGTFEMEDVLNRQKILVVDMPVLGSDTGRIANRLVQHCYMKAAPRVKRHGASFFLCDEFHHTVTPELATFVSHQREALVAPILVTQNLRLLEEKIGETSTLALCGNAVTKIFCRQDDDKTYEWASKLIGERVKIDYSDTRDDRGNKSVTGKEVKEPHVPVEKFPAMTVEEAIILRGGVHWKSTWPHTPDGTEGTVKVVYR